MVHAEQTLNIFNNSYFHLGKSLINGKEKTATV